MTNTTTTASKATETAYTLLDFTGRKIKALDVTSVTARPAGETIEGARRTAQYIASARGERVTVVPGGRDVYPSDAGEHFYP